MRRLLFWHRHSATHPKSPAATCGPTRRFRKLAFQALEPRDLRAVDTSIIVAVPLATAAGSSGNETVHAPTTAPTEASVDATNAIPAASTSADKTNSGPTASASAAVDSTVQTNGPQTSNGNQFTNSDAVNNQATQTGDNGPTTLNNADESHTVASAVSTIQPIVAGGQTGAADGQPDQSPIQPAPAAPVQPPNGGDIHAKDNLGATNPQNHDVADHPSSLAPVARAAASSPSPSNGYGGAAYVQADNTTAGGAATSSADGSGSNSDGYGGGTNGYGGDTGYGGTAPVLSDVTVTNGATNTEITGTVSGESNLAGSTVVFGGQLNGYTTTVNGDNGFQIGIPAVPPIHGTVTVTVIDSHGTPSNTVIIYLS
jgi:hypothetical protein